MQKVNETFFLFQVSIEDQEVLYVNMKKNKPIPLPIPVPSPKLSSFQRLKLDLTDGGSHLNESYTDEPTYYNTKEELTTVHSGVPIDQFNKYIREKELMKNGFKDEFSVSRNSRLILYTVYNLAMV